MSASQTPTESGTAPEVATAGDPSMEDILASIRRILSEDEPPPNSNAQPSMPQPAEAAGSDVLVLDQAMMVSDPTQDVEAAVPLPVPAPTFAPVSAEPAPTALVAPEAAAAAASSLGSLMRTLAAERNLQVRSGGPTVEDLVRDEVRPLLKAWLDNHLPSLVERLVRAEIERVVGRAAP